MKMSTQLRQELAKAMVVAPSCYDALSARLAELAGFKAIHLTGLGLEAAQLGAPDLGLLSMSEVIQSAARMVEATSIPILADVDTGFGGILNVGRTIKEMERAGVAGVHLEDQALPKHCPLLAGRKVVSRDEALDRLKAALDARTDPDFVIVARTDGDTISFEEVVERCNLYLEAGADMVMPMIMQIEGKSYFQFSPDEQIEWARKLINSVNGPVMNMGGSPPNGYTTADLAKLGYAFTMFASTAIGAAANAVASVFKDIMENGTDQAYVSRNPGIYHNPLELMKAARLDYFVNIEQKYTSSINN